jgi:hypothetical protein
LFRRRGIVGSLGLRLRPEHRLLDWLNSVNPVCCKQSGNAKNHRGHAEQAKTRGPQEFRRRRGYVMLISRMAATSNQIKKFVPLM